MLKNKRKVQKSGILNFTQSKAKESESLLELHHLCQMNLSKEISNFAKGSLSKFSILKNASQMEILRRL